MSAHTNPAKELSGAAQADQARHQGFLKAADIARELGQPDVAAAILAHAETHNHLTFVANAADYIPTGVLVAKRGGLLGGAAIARQMYCYKVAQAIEAFVDDHYPIGSPPAKVIPEGLTDDRKGLGRFDHHPDPAIDFCIEVECLESRLHQAQLGLCKPGEQPETIAEVLTAIEAAMVFHVGGDEGAVAAKERLREIAGIARDALLSEVQASEQAYKRLADEAAEVMQRAVAERDEMAKQLAAMKEAQEAVSFVHPEDAEQIGERVIEMVDRLKVMYAACPGTEARWSFVMDDVRYTIRLNIDTKDAGAKAEPGASGQ